MSTRSAARLVWQCPLGTITNTIDVASARILDTRHEDFVCREMLADPRPYRSNRCGRCRTHCSLRKQHSRVAGEFDRPSGLDEGLSAANAPRGSGSNNQTVSEVAFELRLFGPHPFRKVVQEGLWVSPSKYQSHLSSLRNGIDYEAPDHAFDYQEGS